MTRVVSISTLGSVALHGGVVAFLYASASQPFKTSQAGNVPSPVVLTFVERRLCAPIPLGAQGKIQKTPSVSPQKVPVQKKKRKSATQSISKSVQEKGASPQIDGPHGGDVPCDRAQDALPPKLVYAPKPVYPLEARRRGHKGVAHVRVRVGERGEVQEARLATSSGSALLDQCAVEAVSTWRFVPQGHVSIYAVVPVRFTLAEKL